MRKTLGTLSLCLICAGLLPSKVLAEDAVLAMCMEREEEEICTCAAETLAEQIGQEDYLMYDAIGEDYLARMEAGEGRADAWTAASRTEAERRSIGATALMGRTNEIGSAHRAAIEECGG